jgi:hypothetical protein
LSFLGLIGKDAMCYNGFRMTSHFHFAKTLMFVRKTLSLSKALKSFGVVVDHIQ